MKNIVLVTWKGGGNYGTCLQSYALYKKLCNLGYYVRYFSGSPEKYTIKSFLKWIFMMFGIKNYKLIIKRDHKSLQEKKRIKFQTGIYDEIILYFPWQEKKMVSKTECFITGSDQIWNTYYHFSPKMFLSFAGDKKRVAYASSIGTNSIKHEYQELVKQYLNDFSHIGVRENEAVKVLAELTGRNDIRQVLDPTFLLTPDEWRKMSMNAIYEEQLPKDYIFCYLIGQNSCYKEQLHDVHKKIGIKDIIIIPATENKNFFSDEAIVYKNASPVEFVDLLRRAKYVCTDSFHATALCINHSIPFVEFLRFKDDDPKSQNSRIYDILTHFGLMNRLYDVDSLEWTMPVNFNIVQDILTSDRKMSLGYLKNAIEN